MMMEKGVMSLKKFDELADVHAPHCVSIYMPTHRVGKEGYEEDRIRFKDLLKNVKKELVEEYHLKEGEVDAYLRPGYELLEDTMVWHYSGDGLAFFCSEDRAELFQLPLTFEAFHSISDQFYLHPLFPFFNGDGRFYVLGLSEQMVKLWEGSRYRIREVPLEEQLPSRIEEVVGYDHQEKAYQERSFGGGTGGKVSHGHGEGRDDEKVELEKFLREVDRVLSETLRDEHVPLVFAGVEDHYGLYKKVAHYRQLESHDYIKGNPEQMDLSSIHAQGWEIVKERFDADRDYYFQQFKDHLGGNKALEDNAQVVKAAVEGRVEALFIEKGTRLYGIYDPNEWQVRLDEAKTTDNADLVEMAAMKTHRKGGRVFLLASDEMPASGTKLNAFLRY